MEGDVTRGVISGVASTVGSSIEYAAVGLLFGGFNPKYKKEERKKIRYIQSKYAQAYGNGKIPSW